MRREIRSTHQISHSRYRDLPLSSSHFSFARRLPSFDVLSVVLSVLMFLLWEKKARKRITEKETMSTESRQQNKQTCCVNIWICSYYWLWSGSFFFFSRSLTRVLCSCIPRQGGLRTGTGQGGRRNVCSCSTEILVQSFTRSTLSSLSFLHAVNKVYKSWKNESIFCFSTVCLLHSS